MASSAGEAERPLCRLLKVRPKHPLFQNAILRTTAVIALLTMAESVRADGGGAGTLVPVLLSPFSGGHGVVFTTGIDRTGLIGGQSVMNGHYHACRWDGNGVPTDLTPAFDLGPTNVIAVNGQGDFLVEEDDITTNPPQRIIHFRLFKGGAIIDLDALGFSTFKDVNDNGELLGRLPTGHVALWSNGSQTDLGAGTPIALNNVTQVLAMGANGPYLWQNGTTTALGELVPGFQLEPVAMNDLGHVVGHTQTSRGQLGFLWKQGTLVELNPASTYTAPRDINNKGRVVGETVVGAGEPFFWEHGQLTLLRPLVDPASGWVMASALFVNDSGRIVGNAFFEQNTLDDTVFIDLPNGADAGTTLDAGSEPDAAERADSSIDGRTHDASRDANTTFSDASSETGDVDAELPPVDASTIGNRQGYRTESGCSCSLGAQPSEPAFQGCLFALLTLLVVRARRPCE